MCIQIEKRAFHTCICAKLWLYHNVYKKNHSFRRIKWASLITICPFSVVVVVFVVGVVVDVLVNFSHFLLLLQNHWANQTWHKESLSEGDSSLIKWRATRPISTKFGTKHSWVRGIVAYSKEGPRPFIRGDSYEIPKMHWWNYSPESQGRLQPNLAQSILGWRGLKCVQSKGPTFPKRK